MISYLCCILLLAPTSKCRVKIVQHKETFKKFRITERSRLFFSSILHAYIILWIFEHKICLQKYPNRPYWENASSCKDNTLLSYLAICIVPFEQLHHSVWRFYNRAFQPAHWRYLLCDIDSRLVFSWNVSHCLRGDAGARCVHVSVCICTWDYFKVTNTLIKEYAQQQAVTNQQAQTNDKAGDRIKLDVTHAMNDADAKQPSREGEWLCTIQEVSMCVINSG